jgi:glycosyltransferase involved in cell wall biosynthesis
MNMPSYYQNDLFNELSKRFEKFEVVYAHESDQSRKQQGWNFDFIQKYKFKIIGKSLKLSTLIFYVYTNRKSIHIVNGIWAEKYFFLIIIFLNLFGSRFFIYSEAPIPQKKRHAVKQMCLDFIVKPTSKLLIRRAKGFLAVSVFAENYFKSFGVETSKVYRFGYFRNVEKPDFIEAKSEIQQLIFVGQLIERKGIFTLLEALKSLVEKNQSFHLNIIGGGILENHIKQYIQTNNLGDFITLQGVIDSENVAHFIQKADLLILPSLFDGWGIVVNEAIQNYVPVLISDQCGAKELVKHGENGLVFEAQNVKSLSKQVLKFLQLSKEEKANMKIKVMDTSQKIEIPQIVNYLMKCLNHTEINTLQKPIAPWLL